MSHTKEPWEHIQESSGSLPFVVTDANGEREAFYVDHSNGDQIARRIVACVNACEGISTETLEQRGMIPVTTLEQQRDEILNALKALRNVKTTSELAWAHELADAAIAKVCAGETDPEGHNDREEGRDAALSRRVHSHDGLGGAVSPAPTFKGEDDGH